MTLDLTDEQRLAVQRGEPVRLLSGDLGEVLIVSATAYENALDDNEKAAWAELNRKARQRWGQENPY